LQYIHLSTHPADRISPIRGRLRDPSIDGIFPLRGDYNIHPSSIRLCCWDFPHLEDRVCTLRWWDFSHSEVSMQTCLWAFLGSPMGAKTLHYGISPTQNLPLCGRIFPSDPLSGVPLMGLPQLGAQTLAYGLPSSEPSGGWASIVFFYRFLPYSNDGIAPTRETTLLMGYPPHKRTTPLMGLLPHWRYRIVAE